MAFRHYEGGGLPGTEVKKVSPPPAAPPPRRPAAPVPVDPDPPVVYDSVAEALDAVNEEHFNTGKRADETKDHLIYAVQIEHLPTNTRAYEPGVSPEDAFERARTAMERAMPIRALVWDDGSPVEGLARQILSEALEQFSSDLRADPQVALMIGRLKGALGEE